MVHELCSARDRCELWASFVRKEGIKRMAEIGVMRGVFTNAMLSACPCIERYFMIDPWRHLEGWNKPANMDNERFAECRDEAIRATQWASARRIVLRGTTSEAIGQIEDGSLDLAYIDGDHTLRGITIDLIRAFPKVRDGGWIGGDDFTPSIWQHAREYEPTLVFPFAVHFAESVDCPIFALPHGQFLLRKGGGFVFRDLVGEYGDRSLLVQLGSTGDRSGDAAGRP